MPSYTSDIVRHPSSPTFSATPTHDKAEGGYDRHRTDVLSAVDWLGHRFSVGDKVLYCIGAGRGQMMALGTIRAIRAQPRSDLISWDWEVVNGINRRINEVRRDSWDVEVQVLTERTSGAWDNKQRSRPAWVNPMNITSLDGIREGEEA